MQPIIDVPRYVGVHAQRLADAGVRTVFRYYNIRNSTALPDKCLTAKELAELTEAGLSVGVVFQQRGGAGGHLEDLSPANGRRDAARSLALAANLGQPIGSAIYFAVDWDYFRHGELAAIEAYFAEIAPAIRAAGYRVGCYGSGAVGDRLRTAGLVDFVWLSGSIGWSGTRAALAAGRYTLFQRYLNQSELGIGHDGNELNPANGPDFGQFGGAAARDETGRPRIAAGAHFVVTARPSLNLRGGPGTEFEVLRSLPTGTMVTAVGVEREWLLVDLEGDGLAEGYVHRSFLERVSGGRPLPGHGSTPLDVARAELALDVAEFPGAQHNPRIIMYHATTTLAATTDEVHWCSSFVNYCVEQSGRRGTDSAAAQSWKAWGADVTDEPQIGDIAVFRRGPAGAATGHVGFWLGEAGGRISVLGGNQSNRVRISDYPKDGGDYKLLSIRRG